MADLTLWASHKRENPTDDMISGLIHHAAADPALTGDELANIANLLLIAGYESTASMLGLGTFVLLQRPDQLAALRDDPSRMRDAVEELLRYLSVIHIGLFRFPKEDLELGGAHIPAGSTSASPCHPKRLPCATRCCTMA